ncbi:hypothetical protein SETIT_5G280300v2 [Setaria italica]|uniref:DUF7086 domain-containing protein n=2 Tax=Setaria TaxID=4554 RepID=A0A368R9W8_SETIT|nr:hypothetical protein SETIT_5G280300v2 [Setaria italica]TKW16185.1 hypothetical protein SEVIR_5G282700v2 [Setaria viridis]
MEGKAPRGRDGDDDQDPLALTLGSIYAAADAAPASPPPPPSPPPRAAPRSVRRRLNNGSAARRPCGKPRDADAAVDAGVQRPPFPWATERPAQHDTLEGLLRRGVTSVEGQARCKRCSDRKTIEYDLEPKFRALRDYVVANRHAMNDRAPDVWMYPALPDCDKCGNKGAMWPEIAAEKREINWLFLLLGQMLGCCTLEQLKHRTGAKNRVLYYAYIEMCNQLEPLD